MKGELTRDDLALGMPVGHPLYPLPPTIYRAKGCPRCKNIGYTGRIGVYELFVPARGSLRT